LRSEHGVPEAVDDGRLDPRGLVAALELEQLPAGGGVGGDLGRRADPLALLAWPAALPGRRCGGGAQRAAFWRSSTQAATRSGSRRSALLE
jgi:hypothetical protein